MTTDDQFLADLQNKADRVHKTSANADRPPANAWVGILAAASTQQIDQKEEQMTTLAMPHTELRSPVNPERYKPIPRFLNIAVSAVIIAALAFGGWFAAMQLNDPGAPTPDPRFAVIATPGASATPQSNDATCDIEPMTVDEVMEIVENPYKYAEPSSYGPPNSSPAPWYDDFAEVQPMVSENLSGVLGEEPTESAMQGALPVLDNYLACRENGTVAQALRFVDPFSIQERVTSEFPFYRDEEQVRTFVSNWIMQEPGPDEWHDEDAGNSLRFEPNRNTDEARTQVLWLGLGFNQVLFLGSNVMDGDGNYLGRHDASLKLVDGEQQERFMRYTLVYSIYTDQWYVVPGMWPMAPQI